MGNWDDVSVARRYHERTKHSFESVRRSAHRLEWENRPSPWKEYRSLAPVVLPEALPLARVLRWGAGVVRRREVGPGDAYHFRTYASAGALYPVEVYVAAGDLEGLAAGLYHFHPLENALRPLRAGDHRAVLAEAADAPELARAEAVLVLTGILWRTAWKYGARGYRHLYWDAGTMLANLLALAREPRLVTGFVDARVNELVGVDGKREAALALLASGQAARAGAPPPLRPLDLDVAPLSAHEREYPEAHALHAASTLASVDELRRYRRPAPEPAPLAVARIEQVLRRRGSARTFTPAPLPVSDLEEILRDATNPIPSDVPALTRPYLIANAVQGLEPGAYGFREREFELLKRGDFRARAAYLCLEQEHGGRAAATHFFLADLDRTLVALGNRGYRAAQLEAGIRAGRVYLGSYARGYGATGLTFYDDDVGRFFTAGTRFQPMLCVAAGPYARRAQIRR
ncbi:MAG: SagB family peptide dehydrogenase [Actinomycetota bacterium]|nr:SagB family peptide dehydrogenase [Actinomycetota bacterium]